MNVSKKSSVFSIIQHLNDLTCILLKLCRKEKPGLNIGEIRSNHWTKWIQSKKKVAVEVYLSTFTSLTETVQILFNVVIQLCHLLPDKKTLVVVPGQGQWHHSISTQYLVAYRYQTTRSPCQALQSVKALTFQNAAVLYQFWAQNLNENLFIYPFP